MRADARRLSAEMPDAAQSVAIGRFAQDYSGQLQFKAAPLLPAEQFSQPLIFLNVFLNLEQLKAQLLIFMAQAFILLQ